MTPHERTVALTSMDAVALRTASSTMILFAQQLTARERSGIREHLLRALGDSPGAVVIAIPRGMVSTMLATPFADDLASPIADVPAAPRPGDPPSGRRQPLHHPIVRIPPRHLAGAPRPAGSSRRPKAARWWTRWRERLHDREGA
jgi:hypothetical protein